MNRWTSSSLSTAGTSIEGKAQTVNAVGEEGWKGNSGTGFSVFAGVALASISVLVCAIVMLLSAAFSAGKSKR